jgi:hypothetical protein
LNFWIGWGVLFWWWNPIPGINTSLQWGDRGLESLLHNLAEYFMKASTIKGISFQHCQRDANQVAHELARNAFSSKNFLSWEGDPLGFIKPFVIKDGQCCQMNKCH